MEAQRILFPVDFSDYSAACLDEGRRQFAGDKIQEVHFLYVLHSPTDFSNWQGDPTEQVESRLSEFVQKFNPIHEAEVKLVVTTGHPSSQICRYAADEHCNLIVMATHGRTGLSHMLMGSTAEQVVRHAPCPVLTLRVVPAADHSLHVANAGHAITSN